MVLRPAHFAISLLIGLSGFLEKGYGQTCNGRFLMKKGATAEYEIRVPGNNDPGRETMHIEDVTVENGVLTAKVKSSVGDFVTEYDVTCNGEEVLLGLEYRLSANTKTTQVDHKDMLIPLNAAPGTTLPDAYNHMYMTSTHWQNGSPSTNRIETGTEYRQRRVTGTESITTPAGTFECLLIEENIHLAGSKKPTYLAKTWYGVGVGAVRTEHYKKNGKLERSIVLKKLSGN